MSRFFRTIFKSLFNGISLDACQKKFIDISFVLIFEPFSFPFRFTFNFNILVYVRYSLFYLLWYPALFLLHKYSFWIIYIILFYCIYFHLSSFTRSIKYEGKSLLDQSPSLLSSPFSLFEIKIELKNSLNLEINQCSSYFFVPSLNLLESISIFKSLLLIASAVK